MLTSKSNKLAVGVLIFFSLFHIPSFGQSNHDIYVVIGAFRIKSNATRYAQHIRSENMDANVELNLDRNLYYVYTSRSSDIEASIQQARELRQNEKFSDAWVYQGSLGSQQASSSVAQASADSSVQENESDTRSIADASPTSEPDENSPDTSQEEPVSADPIQESSTDNINNAQEQDSPANSDVEAKEAVEVMEAPVITEDFKLYINAINLKKFKEVKGNFEVRDKVRNKKLKDIKSHELFGINDPKNGSHEIKIVSQAFGYRPMEHIVNLENPVNDSTSSYIETVGDSIIVTFDLERLRRGEIAVMWNVLFFKDAAIMRPESKRELDDLLGMLKENDKLKVRIHGHTNGNSHGKILHLDLDDKNFFSLSGNHVENVGSAKKLSEYRAYTIQHYLMDEGIPEDRLEIRGWGGKKMMFDKHDEGARKNVRVEVEILEL